MVDEMTNSDVNAIEILELRALSEEQLRVAAQVLYASFHQDWPEAWETLEDAMNEVRECCAEDRIGRAAIERGTGRVLGWIGGISTYDGRVWELHPLCVTEPRRHQGIGRALVLDLESQVRAAGGLTIYLGTDDESGQTSLSGMNLFQNLWEQIQGIRNLRDHPFSFYQRLGYTIVGVVPDANGPGRPDIMMAKSVMPGPTSLSKEARSNRH